MLTPKQLTKQLEIVLKTQHPIWIWGPPGIGKTQIVEQTAAKLGLPVIDPQVALLESIDARGLPVIDQQASVTKWVPPEFLPKSGEGILFLDELAQAPQPVQKAFLRLTLGRKSGDYKLPDGWRIVAAGNREQDGAGVGKIITPLLNRFIHFELTVSHDDWQDWALHNNVHSVVRAFLRFRPTLLHNFDISSKAFASPRTWRFVSDLLFVADLKDILPAVIGAVGAGPAEELLAFTNVYSKLPDIDTALTNLELVKSKLLDLDAPALCAFVTAVVDRLKDRGATIAEGVAAIALSLPAEYGVLLMKQSVSICSSVLTTTSGRKWTADNLNKLK